MGLAASQARLLTITSRKSDCEYQSMALSHQKIALSRDMNIVSAEYQDALNKTKLVYDFYGNGDKSTQLSYNLLMQPSELNEYRPTPLTDNAGRIVLSPDLAAAAEAAGIPKEGLGCTPSSDIRNIFIQGLVDNDVITQTVGSSVQSVIYNPNAGFGDSQMLSYSLETIKFSQFMEEYLGNVYFDFTDLTLDAGGSRLHLLNERNGEVDNQMMLSLQQILEGDYALYGMTWDLGDIKPEYTIAVDKVGTSNFWNVLYDSLSQAVDPNDSYVQAALSYAQQKTLEKVVSLGSNDFSNAAHYQKSNHKDYDKVEAETKSLSDTYVGYVAVENKRHNNDKNNDGYAINISAMASAFYTYFAMYMEGLASTNLKVENTIANSNFVSTGTNASDFSLEVIQDVDTSGNNLLIANFYDTLFNQIAINGWVTNENVRDNEYLAEMLQNGTMFMSTLADDDYYYQSNYATYKYIKEVTDEQFIAQAEAKYLREKEKIQSKENILDMKMKNLDTEISALTTEYDTVKSVINNTVKSSFTRYEA